MQSSTSFSSASELAQILANKGVVDSDAKWTPLSGGRTNLTWRTRRGAQDVVVKLYAQQAGTPLFPNDPTSEKRALRALAGTDIAPMPITEVETSFGLCLVYVYVEGQPWTTGTPAVAELLHRLHHLTPPSGLRTDPDGSDALVRQAEMLLDLCDSARAELLRSHRPNGYVRPAGAEAFLHGDPVPGNVIDENQNLRLIDWQCPCVGDPCNDLALFLSPAMQLHYRGERLNSREISAFLDAYPDKFIVDRYQLLEPFFHWRMAAYCLWRLDHGDEQSARAFEIEFAELRSKTSHAH